MGNGTRTVAERWPTAVWLNLGQLNQLLESLAQTTTTGGSGRIDPQYRPLIRKIQKARDRRLRAAQGRRLWP